jgi:hypothetical protein
VAKLSSYPKSPRSIINVFAYVESFGTVFLHVDDLDKNEPESYYVSEGSYYNQKLRLVETESTILRIMGFETHVALPYVQCINYLQTLDVFGDPHGKKLALRAHSQLNSALFNPQLLYITHQPSALATAAIYLAAREVGVKLPGEQWWEVFDTDREELGFLVVALQSMEGFVEAEKAKWDNKKLPFTVDTLENEIAAHRKENGMG